MHHADAFYPPWAFGWMMGRFKHGPPPPHPPGPHPHPPHPPHHHGPPHGPPPWVLEMLGAKPKRAERGEVRLLILDAIKDQPRHGYEIIQTIESQTEGGYKPSPGTVYPTLQMLEEMDHARVVEDGGRKKKYEITDEGLEELEAYADEVEEAYERLSRTAFFEDEEMDFPGLFRRLRKLMRTLGRSWRRGSLPPDRLREIHQVIEEAAERLEELIRRR